MGKNQCRGVESEVGPLSQKFDCPVGIASRKMGALISNS